MTEEMIPATAIVDSEYDEVSVVKRGADQMADIMIWKSQHDDLLPSIICVDDSIDKMGYGASDRKSKKESGSCDCGHKGEKGKTCPDCGMIYKAYGSDKKSKGKSKTCPDCGYDMSGSESGDACPDCGTIMKGQPDSSDTHTAGGRKKKSFKQSSKSGTCPECGSTKAMTGQDCPDCGAIMKADSVSLLIKPVRNVLREIEKGDYPGHPFRGNQHGGSSGGSGKGKRGAAKVDAASSDKGATKGKMPKKAKGKPVGTPPSKNRQSENKNADPSAKIGGKWEAHGGDTRRDYDSKGVHTGVTGFVGEFKNWDGKKVWTSQVKDSGSEVRTSEHKTEAEARKATDKVAQDWMTGAITRDYNYPGKGWG